MIEWQYFKEGTVKKVPCLECSKMSPSRPNGWIFRFVPVVGEGRHGSKVKTVRICPDCIKKLGFTINAE